MSYPTTGREALFIEAIDETSNLLESLQELLPVLKEAGQQIAQANASLLESLAAFEGRMNATTQNAKTQTVRHLAAYTEEAARRAVEQNRRAMADAAGIAFGTHVGGAVERLQTTLRSVMQARQPRWEAWLTYAAVAAAASSLTWMLCLHLGQH